MRAYQQVQLFDGKPRLMALSLWQPWASLIAWGLKRYETRSWSTNYRGPLVIQASKSTKGLSWHDTHGYFDSAYEMFNLLPADLPLGAALCVVDLIDVFKTGSLRDAITESGLPMISERERAFGDWSNGRYAWQFENVRIIDPPIVMRGYQQIFDIDQELRDRILAAIGERANG